MRPPNHHHEDHPVDTTTNPVTITFPRACKVHRAAGQTARYAFDQVRLAGGRLVATDGRMLASVPVYGPDGTTELDPVETAGLDVGLPVDVLRAATKGSAKRCARVCVNGTAEVDGVCYPTIDDREVGEFPDYSAVLRTTPEPLTPKDRTNAKHKVRLALNPTLLADLAAALGASDGVVLTFEREVDGRVSSMLRVEPCDSCNAPAGTFGVIMPITTEAAR